MGSMLGFGGGRTRAHMEEEELLSSLVKVHRITGASVPELRELHAVFMKLHPTGFLWKEEFIEENCTIHGGPPALWARVYEYLNVNMVDDRDDDWASCNPAAVDTAIKDAPSPTHRLMGYESSDALKDRQFKHRRKVRRARQGADRQHRVDAPPPISPIAPVDGPLGPQKNAARRKPPLPMLNTTALETAAVALTTATVQAQMPPRLSFEQVMVLTHQQSSCDNRLKRLFRFYDVDGDGMISRSDLSTIVEWTFQLGESLRLRENPEVVLRFVDSSRARYVDTVTDVDTGRCPMVVVSELAPQLASSTGRTAYLMRAMDLNSSGHISEVEFIESCRMDQFLVEILSLPLVVR